MQKKITVILDSLSGNRIAPIFTEKLDKLEIDGALGPVRKPQLQFFRADFYKQFDT